VCLLPGPAVSFPPGRTRPRKVCKINKPVNGDIVNRLLGFIAVTKRHAGFLASFSLYGSRQQLTFPPISRQDMGSVVYQRGHHEISSRNRVIPALLRVSYPQPGRPIGPQDRCPHGLPTKVDLHVCRITRICTNLGSKQLDLPTVSGFSPGYPRSSFRDARLYPEIFHSASTRLPELRVSTEFCELFPE